MNDKSTSDRRYTDRLQRLQGRSWKTVLDVQRPYRWNLRRLQPGRTLDVGCGIGRCLKDLPAGSVGIDHNEHSVGLVTAMGLTAYTPDGFAQAIPRGSRTFDSLLFGHVLEHLRPEEGLSVIRNYLPWLRPNGKVIAFCPQERGYASDPTHVNWLDFAALAALFTAARLVVERSYSFPLPRFFGAWFTYNEFVVIGRKATSFDLDEAEQ
jgi:2-polyprenyl-3-methyl-5-hydroxy-6-metoxy-1,4-benzoquinol methylase